MMCLHNTKDTTCDPDKKSRPIIMHTHGHIKMTGITSLRLCPTLLSLQAVCSNLCEDIPTQ